MSVDVRFGAPNCQNKTEVYTMLLYFDQTYYSWVQNKSLEIPGTSIGRSPRDSKMLAILK